MKEGDWICVSCNDIQFQRNLKCRKCGRERPFAPGQVRATSSRDRGGQPSHGGPPPKRSKWDQEQDPKDLPGIVWPSVNPAKAKEALPGSLLALRDGATDDTPKETKEVVVAASVKGGLIGKGGEFLRFIRVESGATIKIADSPKGDGGVMLKITGSVEEIRIAEELVANRLDEIRTGGYQWKVKVVEVPRDLIGETIGIAGCNLQEIFIKSDCKVKFVKATEIDPSAQPDKQVAQIRGDADKIPIAEKMLLDRVEEVRQKHMVKKANMIARTGTDPLAALGFTRPGEEEQWNAASSMMPRLRDPSKPVSQAVPCKFEMRRLGSCMRSTQCPFSHDPDLIQASHGNSMQGDWNSWGAVEQSTADRDYKTTYCKFWDSGKCTRGATCIFAHGVEELRGGMTPRNRDLMQQAQNMAWEAEQRRSQPPQPAEDGHGSIPAAFKNGGFKAIPKPEEMSIPAAFRLR